MTQCIVMKWVDHLPGVNAAILQERAKVDQKVREAVELEEQAKALRGTAYLESLKLESIIRSAWSDDEVARAKQQAILEVCSELSNNKA